MGECRAKQYTKNDVVLHALLVCFGAAELGTPACEHLVTCMAENGYELRMFRGRMRWKKVKVK